MKNSIPSIMAGLRQTAARSLLGFLGLAVLTVGQAAPATAQLTITEVLVDLPLPNQVTINGANFDNGSNLMVTLGDFPPLAILSPLPLPTPNEIIASLPAGMPVGDFLLTVTTGNGPNRQDTYDLTIGAQITGVPTNAIILWNQNNACPAGFTRVGDFDGRFLVGGATQGTTGGSNDHNHGAGTLTGSAHTHNHVPWNGSPSNVDDNSGGTDYNNTTSSAGGGSVTGTSGSADSRPAFMTILLCRSN